MNEESRNPQDQTQAMGTTSSAGLDQAADKLPEYRIPAPPVPGKTAWSISPWLPE